MKERLFWLLLIMGAGLVAHAAFILFSRWL